MQMRNQPSLEQRSTAYLDVSSHSSVSRRQIPQVISFLIHIHWGLVVIHTWISWFNEMRRPTFKMPLIGAAVQLLTKNHEPSWHQKYPSSESIMMMVVVDNKKKKKKSVVGRQTVRGSQGSRGIIIVVSKRMWREMNNWRGQALQRSNNLPVSITSSRPRVLAERKIKYINTRSINKQQRLRFCQLRTMGRECKSYFLSIRCRNEKTRQTSTCPALRIAFCYCYHVTFILFYLNLTLTGTPSL